MSEPEVKVHRKKGEVREDGKVFWQYRNGKEYWVTPEAFKKYLDSAKKYNPEKSKERVRRWNERNPEKAKEKSRERSRRWYSRNSEKAISLARKWQSRNADKIRDYQRKRNNLRRATDPMFAMKCDLRVRVKSAFERKKWVRPSGIERILGTTISDAKAYIEAQFKPGMTWENRGKWHIDHVIPLASAKTQEELVILCHYTNLQPLWAADNIRKGAKMPHELKKENR